jgi:hypothetical protein
MNGGLGQTMRSGDVALRLSAVFAVAGFIVIAAGIYEIDRREKSSFETVTANLTAIEQRVRILSEQARILNDQYATQINTNERRLHSLDIQIQALESRLNRRPSACSSITTDHLPRPVIAIQRFTGPAVPRLQVHHVFIGEKLNTLVTYRMQSHAGLRS